MQYRGQKAIDLYQEDFKLSDAMWKRATFSPDGPMKVSRCKMSVTGTSLQEYMGMMKSMQDDDRVLLAAHPEHFVCDVSFDEGHLLAIEPFGMYGTPTLVQVKMVKDSEMSERIQADRDSSYPIATCGEAFLADGKTAVNCPFHQLKPTADGFEAKAAVYWSQDTPDEIVSGHSLHLAMEFYRGLVLS